MATEDLLNNPLRVINVGLESFARELEDVGVPVVHVDWSPSALADPALADLLDRLAAPDVAARIETANGEALDRMFKAKPVLVDVRPAGEAIAGLEDRMILHAGPPIEWARMCGPLRGAIAGAAVLEGWADDLDEATAQAAAG